MPVPSPTYLLLNTYDEELLDGPPIHHLDLYRLSESSGEMRLDIPQLLATGTALFEWPERLSTIPKNYLEVHMYPLRPVRPASPSDAVRHGIFFTLRHCRRHPMRYGGQGKAGSQGFLPLKQVLVRIVDGVWFVFVVLDCR